MNFFTTSITVAALFVLPASLSFSQQLERKNVQEIFTPRITDSVCPPDYRTTREVIDMHFKGDVTVVAGPNLYHLAEDFGSGRITAEDFEVLSDARDAEVCAKLNERYSADINRQIRIYYHADPEYLHDIAYYRTPDFNFVVFAGGILIQENPLEPGRRAFYVSPRTVNAVIAFDKNWEMIYGRETRKMISEMGLSRPRH